MTIQSALPQILAVVGIGFLLCARPSAQTVGPKAISYLAATRANYLKLADEVDSTLHRDVLDAWYPRCIDNEHGGFYSDYARDWKPTRSEGKFSVFQGRMTWLAAQIVMRRPELKERYLPYVRHGMDFLSNVMWDREYGGFYWGLNDAGKVSPPYGDYKQLYGMSFGLYGAAAAYQATHDPKALELAQKAFRWIDRHAHDPKNGGYFEVLTREGKPVESGAGAAGAMLIAPLGFKSMNAHIHLLESFTQLYEVWKDPTLRDRLQELLEVNRDKICVEPGVMNLYFTADWRAIPDHDSYGHDVETAYLMLEAEDVLGKGHDPRTERMAKMLVDHGLAYGWDNAYGGFFRDGTTFGRPEDRQKEWWMQFEGLNSFLLMHEKYGGQTDAYFKAFQQQWRFIKDYQIDSEYRGVYEMIRPDRTPATFVKGRIWKGGYHDGRALLNVSERLRTLAQAAPE